MHCIFHFFCVCFCVFAFLLLVFFVYFLFCFVFSKRGCEGRNWGTNPVKLGWALCIDVVTDGYR